MAANINFELPPIKIAVRSIKCNLETDEVGPDEPYVIVVAAKLSGTLSGVEATLYGPWRDVEQYEIMETQPLPLPPWVTEDIADLIRPLTRRPFWGLDNMTAQKIDLAKNVMFLVAVMEHDDGTPEGAREVAKLAVLASLVGSTGLARSIRVEKAIADMNHALDLPTGAPSFDEHIGSTKELALTLTDLLAPLFGPHSRELSFVGDGGSYKVEFVFTKG